VPVVVLEPSCLAVFRDEMKDLLPHNLNARRLSSQAFTLAEFLEKVASGYSPPNLRRQLMVHGHCHQKAIAGMEHETNLLKKMGANVNVFDSGCCGMAGSFGFEENKFEVSRKVFEHELKARVEGAPRDSILIADGFSCKTQIEQNTNREALHLAQVVKMAMDEQESARRDGSGQRSYAELCRNDRHLREWVTAISTGLVVGGILAWRRSR
jgi:Fe-S oxidoreductase